MKIKTAMRVVIWLAAIILLPSMLISRPVYADGAILWIDPPSIIDPSKGVSTIFMVNATITNVTNLWDWQVRVIFNPTVLECTQLFIPPGSPFNFPVQPIPIIDNVTGYAQLGATNLGGGGVSGSGVLACIKFHVKSRGISYINYSRPYDEDTYLLDPDMTPISATLQDGYFSNWIPPPPATLYVNPPRVVDPTLTPCHEFNVSISIMNATDLYTWQLSVWFQTDVLNVTDVIEGPFLKSGGTTHFEYSIIYSVNETYGAVVMSCTITSGVGVSGDGDLATITFHVEGLNETSIPILDDVLHDSMGHTLAHSTFNGYFSNILVAKLSVEPPEIIDYTLVPCSQFDVNITVDDVEDMKSCEFNLTYNTAPLGFIGIAFFKALNQTPSTSMMQDEDAGFIWIRLTYPKSITTYEPVPIVRITFHVDTLGSSPFNLTNTILKNSLGQPIVHEVHHGYFSSLIRDVAVISIETSTTWVYQGNTAYINVTVKNKGNLTETFDVNATYDTTLIGTITVKDLPPDENATITFAWSTSEVPSCHNYTISAHAGPVPYETNLADNTLTDGTIKVRLMGDVNDDGKVDMIDIGIICKAFGSYPGHPRWNPDADLIQDNKIDMKDIGYAAKNYGKTCP
jgi:hypothetical protein